MSPASTGALLAACDDGTSAPGGALDVARRAAALIPATTPDIRGYVTAVTPGDSVPAASGGVAPGAAVSCPPLCAPSGPGLRSVRIEQIPGPLTSGGAKSVVTVLRMPVLRRTAGGVTVDGFGGLRVGQRVSAWFDGPTLESYPSQARARVLVIED
jgi:hypothetical protein